MAFVASSFIGTSEPQCKKTGVRGMVQLVRGNQMPSPDNVNQKPAGLQTTLYIYALTNVSQVTRDGQSPFYQSISTALVKEVQTATDGSFKVKLKPGRYSLFVKKGDLFYSNIYDGDNNIYPIEVKKGEMAEVNFKADYDAVY
jgi:hypothetical protein